MDRVSRLRPIGLELFAMSLIGSGVIRILTPRHHMQRWALGPLRAPALWLRERPMLSRATGVLRVILGLWLVHRMASR